MGDNCMASDISHRHVALLIDDYFEQVEFTEPKEALEQAGAQVTVVSTGTDTLHGMHHAEIADEFMPDELLGEADFEEFDMLVLPGGVINSDHLRMNEKAQDWVHYMIEHEKPIARSEEHTYELQSLMRISYAVFCLKKKKTTNT